MRPPIFFQQRLRNFESHAGAAQFFAGIRASRLVRIQHRQRARQLAGFCQVMVGHDQVHAHAPRRFRRRKRADAGIHADDQPHPAGRRLLDNLVFHAVAIADAMRHMEAGGAAAQLDRGLQDDDGNGSIHVVVAVDHDFFAVGNRRPQSFHRRFHAQHGVGRM